MKTYKSKHLAAIHETISDLRASGLIDKATMRHFDEACLTHAQPLAASEIRAIRNENQVSQAVFALYLGVTAGLVSQWERGEKTPSGPSLKLLSLVKRKGLDAIA